MCVNKRTERRIAYYFVRAPLCSWCETSWTPPRSCAALQDGSRTDWTLYSAWRPVVGECPLRNGSSQQTCRPSSAAESGCHTLTEEDKRTQRCHMEDQPHQDLARKYMSYVRSTFIYKWPLCMGTHILQCIVLKKGQRRGDALALPLNVWLCRKRMTIIKVKHQMYGHNARQPVSSLYTTTVLSDMHSGIFLPPTV